MRRSLIVAAVLCVLGGLQASDAQQFSASYDQTVTHGSEVFTSTVTLKEQQFRIEISSRGERSVILRNSEGIFTYLPEENAAMKLPSLDGAQQPISDLDDYAGYLTRVGAQRTGSDIVRGYLCDVYQFTDSETERRTTAWVWTERQFPVRLEFSGRDGITIVEIANIRVGIDPSDEIFRLPSGVHIMDVDSVFNAEDLDSDTVGQLDERLEVEFQ